MKTAAARTASRLVSSGAVAVAIALAWACGSPPGFESTFDGGTDSDSDADTDADSDSDSDTDFPFAEIYDPAVIPVFEITLPQASIDGLWADPFTYQPGSLRYRPNDDPEDDIALENVGVRLKGMTSFQDLNGKAAFKIKTDEFVDGQRLLGLRRLTFNNMVQDPSMMRERLGYRLFRAVGLDAPMCNHARIYVNGEYFGLYANLQSIDDEFVESLYDPAPGNLYDQPNDQYFVDLTPGSENLFVLETNQDASDTSDLVALIEAVNGPIASFVASAETALDLDQVLAVGGVQAVIADWDGYFGARNNYKLYHELASDKFVLFTWGIDQTFGISDGSYAHFEYAIDGSTSNRENGHLFSRCKELQVCFERYLDAVADALATFEEEPLVEETYSIHDQITDAVAEDTRKPYTYSDYEYAVTQLRAFLDQRAVNVAFQLEQQGR